ncbi:MAG: hypothetical protein OEL87_01630 [Nanoarchaeota archaeon]|nr:hypothetical protein [Nanoarchaeota archaeon]
MTKKDHANKDVEEKPKKKIPPHIKLLFISDSYLIDLECLREMFASVLPVLKDKDKKRKEIVEKIISRATQGIGEEEQEENGSEDNDKKINIPRGDIINIYSNIRKINRGRELFKQQLTVSLISRFDEFLGQLLKIVLRIHPEWLKSSDKTITYKELVNLESIEKAIIGLIHKEVENLLRGSHEDQIKFIDEKLKLGIQNSFTRLPEFLEVTERRNLCVHTGGKVSQQYLDRCEIFGVKNTDSISVGSSLDIDETYFNNAFSLCFELGLRISQAAYRRLFPEELEAADRSINELAIKFLNSGDYNLAEVVCGFYLGIPDKLRSKNNEFNYFAIINRAIAQKFAGEKFEDGLQGVHWQAFHPKYALALHVLHDEYEKAGEAMKTAAIQESVGQIGFRAWPLFKEFRTTNIFKETYLELYKEEYVPDPEKDLEDKSLSKGLILNDS